MTATSAQGWCESVADHFERGGAASKFAEARIRQFLSALSIVAISTAASMGAARADAFDTLFRKPLSLEQRIHLRCPPRSEPGEFSRPVRIYPSETVPFEMDFSEKDDLVRLIGAETEVEVNLGAGDDIALLYDVGAGMSIRGDNGADTILLCSMTDVVASINLGTENLARDDDRDVVIIESDVFTSVPPGMPRIIMIFDFDPATDFLVVHAPSNLIASRKASPQIGGFQLGNVVIRVYGTPMATYSGKAFIFVPE